MRSVHARLSVVSTAALLVACAGNPLVQLPAAQEPQGSLDSMEAARKHAEATKRVFHDRAYAHVGQKVLLNDSLLGLGILTLGLAAGNVHRDAFTATAGLAGASYLFGTQGLQDSALQAYQSGIGALNCAVAAVRPLQVSDRRLQTIESRALALAAPIAALHRARASLGFAAASGDLSLALKARVEAELLDADATVQRAQGALEDAARLPAAVTQAAGGLKSAVDTIGDQVNKFASRSVVDPASIPSTLAKLVQVVDQFAVGLGVGDALGAKLQARQFVPPNPVSQGKGAGPGAPPAPAYLEPARTQQLESLVADLADQRGKTDALARPLAAELSEYKGHKDSEALAQCGVSASVAMKLVGADGDTLSFQAAGELQSKRFSIEGGVKPYGARFQDSPTHGVEVIPPLPGDRSVEVRVPKDAKTLDLQLLVYDAASPPQQRVVLIKVAGATPQDTSPSAPNNQSLNGRALLGFKTKDGHRYQLLAASPQGALTRLELNCQPAAGNARTSSARLKRLLIDKLKRQDATKWSALTEANVSLAGADSCRDLP